MHGNTMVQIYVNDVKYLQTISMKKTSEAGYTLQVLRQDIWILVALHCYGAIDMYYGK
jgi:hypothetical protein